MKHYSVLDVTPINDSWIPAYIAETGAIVKKHGGKYLVRTASHKQIEGQNHNTGLRIILEWPSRQTALGL